MQDSCYILLDIFSDHVPENYEYKVQLSWLTLVPDNGLVTADGRVHEFDSVVCATGFIVAFAPHSFIFFLSLSIFLRINCPFIW